jgi:acetyl-CoA acetyltransferase family protein
VKDVVIVSALRTPVGRHAGALSEVRPDDLAALVILEIVSRTGIDSNEIEEVYLGCANQAGEDNRNVARMATLLAGLPNRVAGVTFNRLCASGLTAVNQAARAIRAGEGDVYLAGGVESMTRAPYSLPKSSRAWGPSGNLTAWDTTLGWRYPNPRMEAMFPLEAMGETAENIYQLSCKGGVAGREITRQEQDSFALESHRRACNAINGGRFRRELVPVTIPQRRGDPVVVDTDETPRVKKTMDGYVLDTSLEQLAKLQPVFRKGGTVTAGNSSGISDGAAVLLLMSADKATKLGVTPMARWIASAAAGVDPRTMGLGPIPASQKALQRADLNVNEIDLVELNEAFAVQSIAVMRELGLRHEITNVNGGAIALGHPLGCSGARLMTSLLHEMQRRRTVGPQARYGLVTLCVGVGQGEATIVEAV